MAISDINRAMSAIAQPTEFDQVAWKKAFDIANAFNTNANNAVSYANNLLKHNENLATSDWRTAHTNNGYEQGIKQNNLKTADLQRLYNNAIATDPSLVQATIAQNNFANTGANIANREALGKEQLMRLVNTHGFNEDGTTRTLPEVWQALQAAGVEMKDPYSTSHFWKAGNQQQQNVQGTLDVLLRNSLGTTVDQFGNVVSTGKIDQDKLNQQLNLAIATGKISQEQANGLLDRLYPTAPETMPTALPTTTSFVPEIGGFSNQLARIGAVNTQTVPYAVGYTPPPFMLQYGIGATPATPHSTLNNVATPMPQETVVAESLVENPLTPAEEEQLTIQALKNWEAGGAKQYWNQFWADKKAMDLARANALKERAYVPKNGYPLFLYNK